jgi:hypothetical protein|tara:strand:+ start:289 stop:564 length:276 start_codon:yes stop_codon:yes gene_type:complete
MSVTKHDHLPFVRVDANGSIESNWDVEKHRSGDYGKDCALGRSFCNALFMRMHLDGYPLLLSRTLEAQVRAGKWGAIEIGFAQQLSEEIST